MNTQILKRGEREKINEETGKNILIRKGEREEGWLILRRSKVKSNRIFLFFLFTSNQWKKTEKIKLV